MNVTLANRFSQLDTVVWLHLHKDFLINYVSKRITQLQQGRRVWEKPHLGVTVCPSQSIPYQRGTAAGLTTELTTPSRCCDVGALAPRRCCQQLTLATRSVKNEGELTLPKASNRKQKKTQSHISVYRDRSSAIYWQVSSASKRFPRRSQLTWQFDGCWGWQSAALNSSECLLSSSLRSAHAIFFLSNAQPHAGHVTCRPTAGVLAVELLARSRSKLVFARLQSVPSRQWTEGNKKPRISKALAQTTNIAESSS